MTTGRDSGAAGSSTATTAAESATSTSASNQTATTAESVQVPDLQRMPQAPAPSGAPPSSSSGTHDQFLTAVFDDVESVWRDEFRGAGLTYKPARLTIFQHAVHTACGSQTADVGPFYCPASSGVYLDPAFFRALSAKAGVKLGDFAQAYVIGHEVGHHVQVLLRVTHQVAAADHADPAAANARSVRVELQADCFAGVWAHSAYHRGELTAADFRDALNAAAVVGDDFLQKSATGEVRPEAFTHGTSEQRQRWLTTGFERGSPAACDTFNTTI